MLASVAGALRNTRLSTSPLSLKDPSLGVFSKVQPFCDFAWFYVASETRALRLAVLAALFLWIQAQHQDLSEVGRKSSRTTNGKTSVHRTRSKTVYHSRGELEVSTICKEEYENASLNFQELQSEITLHRPGTVRCELAGEVLRLPKGGSLI